MPLFGSKKYNPLATVAGQPSIPERVLNQVAANLLGVDFIGMARQKALGEAQRGFMNDLDEALAPGYQDGPPIHVGLGGDDPSQLEYTPPVRTRDPLNANSPELAGLVLKAQRLGVPVSGVLDVLKTQQPNLVVTPTGEAIDTHNRRNEGRIFPQLDKGQTFENGVVSNAPGFVQSSAETAGAVSEAQERAKAAFDLVDIPQRDGSTVKMPRFIAAQILSGQGGGSPPAGFGRSQTPAEAAGAKVKAEATATAQNTLPSDLEAVNNAISTATQLLNDPELKTRLGGFSILPAIPGTHGAAIDATRKQIEGQIFMSARQGLKGAGQVTDFEGQKAANAVARMQTAQNEADYKAALRDYIAALTRGRDIMRQKAGAAPAAGRFTPEAAAAELARRRAARGGQ